MAVMLQGSVASPRLPSVWTTPRILQAALTAILVSTLLILGLALIGAHQRRAALQTIGVQAGPSIIAAQRMKSGLSDMDAAAADVLLLPPGVQQEQSDDRYEARRVEVTEILELEAQKASGGAAEQQALKTLADALGIYETDVAQARLLHLRNEPGSRLVYRMTHSEIHDTLLPAADTVIKTDGDVLEAAYRTQNVSAIISVALIVITGLAALTCLIATQVFLYRRTHRTLSPPLLGATFLVALFLAHTLITFSNDSEALRALKEKTFSTISAIWQVRATMFDADSEESRWLMDIPQAPQYEQIFTTETGQITDALHGASNWTDDPNAAQAITQAYGLFFATDQKIRAMANNGDHGGAVKLCIGQQPGQHQWAFTQFDQALGAALDANLHTFDSAVSESVRRLAGFDILAILMLGAASVLTWIGLQARLREYVF